MKRHADDPDALRTSIWDNYTLEPTVQDDRPSLLTPLDNDPLDDDLLDE